MLEACSSVADRTEIRSALTEAAQDPRIAGAELAGSAARGTEDRWSDIDLILQLAPAADEPAVVEATQGRSIRPRRWQPHLDFMLGHGWRAYDCATARRRETRMTDTQGNSEATQAARDAAERVRMSAADGAESFGATAEQIADEVSAGTQATKSDVAGAVSDIADTVSEKVGDVVDGAKSAASEARAAAGKAADAAVDAAKSATASIKDVADNVDFDSLVAQTKTVAGEWTDKLKQTYRERPGLVIAAAAGALVVLGAIVRSIGRR